LNTVPLSTLKRLGLNASPEEILLHAGCSDNVVRHCRAVAKRAVFMAQQLSGSVDLELVYAGAMLHDIGRGSTHGIKHVAAGAAIAERLGLHERIVAIIRSHVGAGLTPEEARSLGLPPGNYMPATIEEKVVAHADNLTRGTEPVIFAEAAAVLERRLGRDSAALGRIRRLREDILRRRRPDAADPEAPPVDSPVRGDAD